MKKILISSLLLCLSLTACKESFLDKQPYGVVTEETFYKTSEECKGAVMQVYHRTVQLSPWQFGSRFMFSTSNSDDFENVQLATSHLNLFTFMSPDNEQFKWVWNYAYRGIYLANLTIQNIEKSSIVQADKDQYIAECKALRAVFYWTLTTFWGSEPLLTKPLNPDQYFNQTRATPEECWALVQKDLIEAIAVLPATRPTDQLGRVTKGGAQAMLAKAYLQQGNKFKEAEPVLAAIVNSGVYALYSDFGKVWRKEGEQGSEAVWEVNHGYQPGIVIGHEEGPQGNFLQWAWQPKSAEGDCWGCMTEDLKQAYEPGDPRVVYTLLFDGDRWYIDAKGDTTVQNSKQGLPTGNLSLCDGYQLRKYAKRRDERLAWAANGNLFGDPLNYKFIRYSDVLLLYAETLNENGKSAEAVKYVNMVRERANTTPKRDPLRFTQVYTVANTKLPMLDAGLGQSALRDRIQQERRVELAGEAWRYTDLLRWGIAKKTLTAFSQKWPAHTKGTLFKDYFVHFPIPATDVQLSEGKLQQTAGY